MKDKQSAYSVSTVSTPSSICVQQGIYILQGFAHCTAVREELGLAGVEAGDNTVETVATTGKLVSVNNHIFLRSTFRFRD